MRDEEIGRSFRALRHRRGWRQVDLSSRAGVARWSLIDLEAGRIGHLRVDIVRACAEALGGRLVLTLSSGAGDPRLLIDAGHATLQEHWKAKLERWGWVVRAEVSFNHYGDRGRVDLLAFHPTSRVLLVVEIKTVLWDLQALLGGVDVKRRVSPAFVGDFGWRPAAIVPMVVVADGTTARRRLREYESLFAAFEVRGRDAASWLGAPSVGPRGLLVLTKLPDVAPGDLRRAGRRRVRARFSSARSAGAVDVGSTRSGAT
jgi:transcriptional regulator with XRE-family HTH domain